MSKDIDRSEALRRELVGAIVHETGMREVMALPIANVRRPASGPTTVEEQWMAPRGGSVLGMGRTVRAGRTADYELVLISEMNGRLAYKAHPAGQPSATFVSTMASDTSIVFENPEHDFPQRVGYRRDGADGLQAWIEGQANGKPRRVDFSYQRAQCEGP